MEKEIKTKQQLFDEIEGLRMRLKEAEETLSAVRSGEVDAIVVSGQQGEQVFTLTGAERVFRVLIETMNEGAASLNQEGMIIYCNQRFAEMIKTPLEKVIGSTMRQFIRASDIPVFDRLVEQKAQENGKGEVALINNDGTVLPVLLSISAIQLDKVNISNIIVTDLTEQKHVEQELGRHRDNLEERVRDRTNELEISNQQLQEEIAGRKLKEKELQSLNRTLLARSKSSKAMMNARDEAWYLNEVCRIIVEDCGHALVWIGFAEQDEGRTVRPVAHAGFEDGYLDSLKITWSDSERGRGPVGTAIRTGKPVFRSIGSDPAFAPWSEEALKRGYAAVIGVPLLADGKAFGSLNIYSRQEDPFSDDEVQLLSDLASDLSFGIASIRMRVAQMKTVSALRQSEARLKTLVRTIPDLVWLKDANGVYLACNPKCERFFGVRETDIIGRTDYDLVNRDVADVFREHDRKVIAAGKSCSQDDWITFADDGHRVLIDTIKTPMFDAGGKVTGVLGIGRDITERKQAEEALRESEMRYRSLFDNMLEGFAYCKLILEHDRARDFVYLAVNGAFETLTGLRGVVGKKVSEVIPGIQEANPEILEIYGRVALTGTPERFETFSNAFGGWLSISVYSTEQEYFAVVFENITERKRAEAKLRENEARLQTLVQTIPDLVWLKDADGVYLACNPMFERLYGAKESDIVGKTDYDFVNRELADFFREHDRMAIAAGKPSSNEEWLTFADDGHRALMDTIKTPMYDARGSVVGVLGISRDITERKQAEEDLRFKNTVLATQQEVSLDGILLVDGEGRILNYNARFVDMWGIASELLESKSDERMLQAVMDRVEYPEEFIGKVQHLYEAREEKSRDEIALKDGRTFDRYSAPMVGLDGTYYGRIWYFRDITERKQAEEELVASEEQFRRLYQEFHGLLDAVPDSLMLIDKDMKVLWANKVAADLTGGIPEAIIGQRCHALWYQQTTPCDSCPVIESFSTGRPMSETVTRPDGRVFDIRTVPLIDQGGSIARVIEVVRDVTEHGKLEAQYLQAQKMESIGTLAGGVAHDFNNILSAIIGYSHVTLMKMAAGDPLRPNIEHILEATERAARLTRALLLFSRKHVIQRNPVDVNEVIKVVLKFLKMVIGEDVECKTMLQERSLTVNADSHQLEQVLMNLATNARDAMPRGGAFTIKTEQINITEDFTRAHGYGRSGPYAMVTVSDTGIGMDEATRKHVFEPFYTTKGVGKGTGLGLAVVYGIIKQHEGFINLYSEPGMGTTFRIYLPLIASEAVKDTVPRLIDPPVRGTETVLLAEDEGNLRKLSAGLLEEFGYTVIDAVDGEEAVTKFMENKDTIQLLLFDLIMPKMNGKEASDEIRKIKPGMKVLFASGYDPDLLQQKTLLEEGVHLVYKPISPMDLLRKVRSVLDEVK